MIRYPNLQAGAAIGITAPSSGVQPELHGLVKQACARLEAKGYRLVVGETVWTQHKAKSAPADVRAAELNAMLQDERLSLIFPPWGGELLIEVVDRIDYEAIKPKWILGYSDTSALLLAVTLMTGLATAHGANLIDVRGEVADETTGMWETVLGTRAGESVRQPSSPMYQQAWDHDNPTPCVFHLTEPTRWKTVGGGSVHMSGRLLGGCVDIIRHLVGTPYGDVKRFREERMNEEPVIWYLENCELSMADMRRSLVQMKLAGWFDHCGGLLFGRSEANRPTEGYMAEDLYRELAEELGVPVLYDVDCGHVPPQLTFVNGARAEIEAHEGKAVVTQFFEA
ncbi:S66 family peptidase [Paenibacillus methanolicus]|uniref:Muramoyltetrapeptide carboxypeptidase LdcA involved in peptidoglycan recycling n=1 Tax=Paenibacillus methanolicus TaxID=582686 RepID=A0A5S5CMT8_9BACL|nr:S66 peptidase family protein [Paenibacillus methanolicus]TYP79688.1 muramoyltetrapeptide carboxypeptidase LdcA involved in peptidoglycan recycling [Paenibacillus methanolicus]